MTVIIEDSQSPQQFILTLPVSEELELTVGEAEKIQQQVDFTGNLRDIFKRHGKEQSDPVDANDANRENALMEMISAVVVDNQNRRKAIRKILGNERTTRLTQLQFQHAAFELGDLRLALRIAGVKYDQEQLEAEEDLQFAVLANRVAEAKLAILLPVAEQVLDRPLRKFAGEPFLDKYSRDRLVR